MLSGAQLEAARWVAAARRSTLNSQHSTLPPALKQRLLQTVGRSARLKVLNELKRTQGLPVAEIAARIGMSYMGVKDLCTDLAKRGLLDTWRTPVQKGRPRMHYRLTQRAHDLFPTTSNETTIALLEAAQKLFGPTAPEKLLLVVFQRQTERYMERLRGDNLAECVQSLARLRDHDGFMAEFEHGADGALRIVEHHSPVFDLLQAFPIVARLEAEMFQRILRAPVRREEHLASGLYTCTSHIG